MAGVHEGRVNITEAERLGARAEPFAITRPFCKSFTVGKNDIKLHQELVWLVGWLLTEG